VIRLFTDPSPAGGLVLSTLLVLACAAGVALASDRDEPPLTQDKIDAALLRWAHVASRHPLRRLPLYRAAVAAAVHDSATRHGLRPALVLAIILRESSGRDDVTGPAGELGLMQIHPRTAVRWRCRLGTPAEQVECGCRVLAHHVARCGSESGGLGAYASRSGACDWPADSGPGRVARDRLELAREIRREALGDRGGR
jgi:hypothetical protein